MPEFTYTDRLEVRPLDGPLDAVVKVPGSKSITNRALVLAALGRRGDLRDRTTLTGALRSEDTEVMIGALRRLGFTVREDWERDRIEVGNPVASLIPAGEADLFLANSGTSMRFLAAMVSLGRGRYRLDGVARMRERPIADLLDALAQLDITARSETDNGCPPVVIDADGWKTGSVRVRGDVSSQFLTGLILSAPFADGETTIEVDGTLVSRPYVWLTTDMLRQWGLEVGIEDGRKFRIAGRQRSGLSEYDIEPDASAASYWWAAAAIAGGRVTVPSLNMKSLQGDVRFVDLLEEMGCVVVRADSGITVRAGKTLRGIDADMNDISDTVMTLGAVALFADGPTTIRNVGHIRHKETDRIAALATELRKLGAGVEERDDGLTITPGPLRGAALDTYDDHRMAMSLALVGLRVPGVLINDPGCVRKTYPGYWHDWERVGEAG